MPIRKIKTSKGIRYKYGKTGKVYKKRKDAVKQGQAVEISKKKRRKK